MLHKLTTSIIALFNTLKIAPSVYVSTDEVNVFLQSKAWNVMRKSIAMRIDAALNILISQSSTGEQTAAARGAIIALRPFLEPECIFDVSENNDEGSMDENIRNERRLREIFEILDQELSRKEKTNRKGQQSGN